MCTIDKGSLVLVTGVSGYVASHTAFQLLEAGYNVRGTVRAKEKADWLYELFDEKYGKGRFEAAIVPDMMADNAFDEAVKGVSGVCHMASVTSFSDKPEEVIPTVVHGATNIMTAASKESSIRAFVYTSSSTAALMPQPDKVIKVTKETWNQDSVDLAHGQNPHPYTIYGASKTEAERAVWKAVDEKNIKFQVAAVLPDVNIGPVIKPNGEDSSSTTSSVLELFHGDADAFDAFPPQWFVDVRDTARLHVIALTDPDCNGQRLFAFAEPFNRTDLLDVFRKLFPNTKFPEDKPVGRDLSQIPNEDANALLKKHYGNGFTSLADCLEALTANYR